MSAPPFAPFDEIDGSASAGVLFLCDHASNALPPAYGSLGLPPDAFDRHIAYDIGAAALTRRLAALFGAPAVLTRFSRLLIDPNRGADDPTLVMRLSDGAIVPGNAAADEAEIARRLETFWRPYRDAVAARLDAMTAAGPLPALVSLHSFTPAWKGRARPWEIGVLWDADPRLPRPFMAALRAQGFTVGDNEPYDGALPGDTIDHHATSRGLANLLIEVRQDLIATDAAAAAMAERLGVPLAQVLEAPDIRSIAHYPSRARARSIKESRA